jgi:hypothetical protein
VTTVCTVITGVLGYLLTPLLLAPLMLAVANAQAGTAAHSPTRPALYDPNHPGSEAS